MTNEGNNNAADSGGGAGAGVSWRNRIFFCLLCASMTMFFYHSSVLIQRFKEKPVSTEIKYGAASQFPQIMLCNSIPASVNRFMSYEDMDRFVDQYKVYRSLLRSVLGRGMTTAYLFSMRGTLKDQPALTKLYGIELEELVLECRYNGEVCGHEDFQLFYHDNFMNCYQFKPVRDNTALSNLNLVLLSKNDDVEVYNRLQPTRYSRYKKLTSSSYRFDGPPEKDFSGGVKLFVHPVGVYPHDKYKLEVGTGQETFIQMSQMEIKTLNLPKKPCMEEREDVKYVNLGGDEETVYKRIYEDCILEVMLKQTLKHCGCLPSKKMPPHIHKLGPLCFDLHDVRNQNLSKSVIEWRLRCYTNIKQHLKQITENSTCSKPCDITAYKTHVEVKKWPNEAAIPQTMHQYLDPLLRLAVNKSYEKTAAHTLMRYVESLEEFHTKTSSSKSNSSYREARDDLNYAFYSSFSKIHIELHPEGTVVQESLAYELSQLLSDLGGISGVYLGASILTLVELWFLIHHIVHKKRREHTDRNGQTNSNTDNQEIRV